jgi:hypothetical protein
MINSFRVNLLAFGGELFSSCSKPASDSRAEAYHRTHSTMEADLRCCCDGVRLCLCGTVPLTSPFFIPQTIHE